MRIFQPGPERFLSGDEKAAVAALFEAIMPGDEHSPGARDADAAEYVSVLLAQDAATYYEIPAWQELYRAALPALERAGTAGDGGRGLAQLGVPEATALLADLAAGSVAGMPPEIDQKRLFATLRAHCIEACFADPRWGGNRDAVIWRWFGYLKPAEEFHREEAHDARVA
jgi:gluconate 2-dehydrogenase gamma chain